MQLTLYVPGLLLPDAVRDDVLFDLDAPTLSLILGRAQRHHEGADWLARAFSASPPLPIAALRRAAENPAGAWLCLDPVHWLVGREGITLDDPSRLALAPEEAESLCAAVAPVFAPWGELSASAPGEWELRLTRSLMLETRSLPAAAGHPIDPALPGGLDGAAWRQCLAEAQTLLHGHAANRAREAAGKPVVNSLWPWGFGALPEKIEAACDVVWSRDTVLAGLALLAGIPCLSLPDGFAIASGRVLCHIDALTVPARTLNALTWRLALLALERDWLAPALAALKKGHCSALRIVATDATGAGRTEIFSLVRGNLWRFWKRPLPLAALAAAA